MKGIHRADSNVRRHYALTKSDGIRLNTRLLYAGKLQRSKHWKEVLHSHAFCEIVYVLSGMGEVQIGEIVKPIKRGDILVYNPNVPHMEYTKGNTPMELAFFGVTELNLNDLPPDHLISDGISPVISTGDRAKKFDLCFQSLVDETENEQQFGEIMSGYWSKLILTGILRQINVSEQTMVKNNIFSRIYAYLSEHFAEVRSIDSVCSELYVSKYYLSHVFKKYTGIAPMQYVAQCRLAHAKKLLAETDLSACEISERCGYGDCTSFFKTFKKTEGTTPIAYRNRMKNEKSERQLSEVCCQ